MASENDKIYRVLEAFGWDPNGLIKEKIVVANVYPCGTYTFYECKTHTCKMDKSVIFQKEKKN